MTDNSTSIAPALTSNFTFICGAEGHETVPSGHLSLHILTRSLTQTAFPEHISLSGRQQWSAYQVNSSTVALRGFGYLLMLLTWGCFVKVKSVGVSINCNGIQVVGQSGPDSAQNANYEYTRNNSPVFRSEEVATGWRQNRDNSWTAIRNLVSLFWSWQVAFQVGGGESTVNTDVSLSVPSLPFSSSTYLCTIWMVFPVLAECPCWRVMSTAWILADCRASTLTVEAFRKVLHVCLHNVQAWAHADLSCSQEGCHLLWQYQMSAVAAHGVPHMLPIVRPARLSL